MSNETYFYYERTFELNGAKTAVLEVKIKSDGFASSTRINIPGTEDPANIEHSGKRDLKSVKNLLVRPTILTTAISADVATSDTLEVEYWINGTLLVNHDEEYTAGQPQLIEISIKVIR